MTSLFSPARVFHPSEGSSTLFLDSDDEQFRRPLRRSTTDWLKIWSKTNMINAIELLLLFVALLSLRTNAESSRSGEGVSKWLPPQLHPVPEDVPTTSSRSGPTEVEYERFAACLAASGMQLNDFNALGKQINQNTKLKNKVTEQASLYRMAAQFQRDPDDVTSSKTKIPDQLQTRLVMFCESMVEIERLRANQRRRLKKSLNVDDIPESLKISDESLKPFLNPKVRAVVEAFPLQAEEIVNRIGLEPDEFNEMLQETKSNPAFRRLVENYMKEKVVKEFRANTGSS